MPGHPERVEHRGIEVDDVPAGVEAEHLELGPDPLGAGHLGQSARRGEPWGVTEVEGELGGHLGRDGGRALRLGCGEGPDVAVGRDRGDPAPVAAARRGDPTARPALRARPAVELGDVEQQVTPGDPATSAETAARPAHAAARVASSSRAGPPRSMPWSASKPPARTSRSADGSRHPGPLPEVGQARVGLAGDDLRDLGLADAVDVGEGEPDRLAAVVGALEPVGAGRDVDVETEHGDAEGTGVVEDEPLGIHPRVMGQHPGEERCGVVRLEPGRLVGRQGEGRRVRLAEAEGGESLEDLPDPVGDLGVVAACQRGRTPPLLDPELPVGGAEGPTHLVGLREGHAGRLGDDHQHLLVEDDDPLGLLEGRDEARVQVGGVLPALAGVEEGHDHVALDRAGPEERDVDDEVLEGLRTELADELALPRALDLEAPEGPRRADQLEGRLVVEGHLRLVVEIEVHAVDTLDLEGGVCHGRLHPDAEDVELEQAHLLDVVLVELAHREAEPARLDRSAVEQHRVGQHDPAGVQGDVARQPVEPLDDVEHQLEPGHVETTGPQLGQLGEGMAHVAGGDVRERLGHGVDLGRWQPERRTGVTDGVAHPVGVHHRDARDPVAAEVVEDPLVDLGASGRLHVDVDVGQLGPQRGAEALHEQPVAHRVDPGDAEEEVDERARTRASGRDPHPHLADEVAHLRDGEEVGRVAERLDDAQLVLESRR